MTTIPIDRKLPDGYLGAALRHDARTGLTSVPKALPPKWFYDDTGSELFDQITRLEEYYPTRAEREILGERAPRIAAATGASTLVELGSGTGDKTKLLLDALAAAGTLRRYVPVDVSEAALVAASTMMTRRYPGLEVSAVLSDFTAEPGLPEPAGPRLVALLGGTIGNLLPGERADFLRGVRRGLLPGDALVLGADLVKDERALVRAYDDAAGVTARFNKNILSVLNSELGADFDPDQFEHVARWDAGRRWIEMRLRSRCDQAVLLPGIELRALFCAGEEMRTEVSAKFSPEQVAGELAGAGFAARTWWTDSQARYGLCLATPAAVGPPGLHGDGADAAC